MSKDPYAKSKKFAKKLDDTSAKMWLEDEKGDRPIDMDHARRLSQAGEYLGMRANRSYGSGYDMVAHGEGRKHGSK